MNKTLKLLVLCAFAGLTVVGCGDDDGPLPDTGVTPDGDVTPPTGGLRGRDNPIALGEQTDRAGRAAVATGTVGTLTFPSAMDEARNALKDEYGRNDDPSTWIGFAAGIEANIALLDGVDGTCGNQLGFDAGDDDDVDDDGTAYTFLSTVLADDRLFVNANSGTCGVYLGVEADVTGIFPNETCGGRTPLDDVMDVTYTVLAAGPGALNLPAGPPAVSDGLTADNVTHDPATFPFFAAP